jgi:hypothetical protein
LNSSEKINFHLPVGPTGAGVLSGGDFGEKDIPVIGQARKVGCEITWIVLSKHCMLAAKIREIGKRYMVIYL